MKDLLNKITNLQDLAYDRGIDLLRIGNIDNKVYCEGYDFDNTGVDIRYKEQYHDCPDTYSIRLTIEQLEMSNKDWKSFIESESKKLDQKKHEAMMKERQQDFDKKKNQYEQLKKELGY